MCRVTTVDCESPQAFIYLRTGDNSTVGYIQGVNGAMQVGAVPAAHRCGGLKARNRIALASTPSACSARGGPLATASSAGGTGTIVTAPARRDVAYINRSCCWRCLRAGWRTATGGTRCCGGLQQLEPLRVRRHTDSRHELTAGAATLKAEYLVLSHSTTGHVGVTSAICSFARGLCQQHL